MPHKVVTDKNGRMRTVDVEPPPSREAIDTLRREVKDIVAGNTQFHDDEFAKPKALPPIDGFLTEDEWIAPCFPVTATECRAANARLVGMVLTAMNELCDQVLKAPHA